MELHQYLKKYSKPDGDCIIWTGSRVYGYGNAFFKGKKWRAHRLAYTLHIGPIPNGLYVCHHCDNNSCINPEHLFVGTQFDNMRDSARKGRNVLQRHPEKSFWHTDRAKTLVPKGEQHGCHKLTTEQVIKIRRLRALGVMARTLADRYSVHPTHITRITSGRGWSHVPAVKGEA